jgi:hypothetical protein
MVEAAIYFPIAVLTAMVVLHILIALYSQTCTQSYLHRSVRVQAEALWENTEMRHGEAHHIDRFAISAEKSVTAVPRGDNAVGIRVYEAWMNQNYYGGRLIAAGGVQTEFYARAYAVDEEILVRVRAIMLQK